MTDGLHMEGGITANRDNNQDDKDGSGNLEDDLEERADDKSKTGTSTAANDDKKDEKKKKDDDKKDENKDQKEDLNGHENIGDEEEEDDSWRPNTEPYIVLLDDIACDVYIEDEGGKINLNTVNDESKDIFLDLLTSNGIEEEDADVIVDSTIDWIDKDDWHHINGAESPYYESLAEPYEAKNAKFDSIEELRLVKGVTSDVYESIRSFITVFGSDKINLNFADKEVLVSIPEINEEMANAILEHIEKHGSINSESELKVILSNPALKTKDIPIEEILKFITLETQDTVTIRSICSSSENSKDSDEKFHQYRIIVAIDSDNREILAVYAD